jgi:hypothetical protein
VHYIRRALIHRVIVEAKFGSAHQRDVAMRVIREYLEAWKVSVEERHRKNEVIIAEHELSSGPVAGWLFNSLRTK